MFSLDAYLNRIGFTGRPRANAMTLCELHELHMLHVPFENLDVRLGRRIELDEEKFFDKIVTGGRGGFCYEMNGLFARVLSEIGFDVTRVAAQVAHGDGTFGIEFDHMALIVRAGEEWLADVGFGDSFRRPLRLRAVDPQTDPTGLYQIKHEDVFTVRRQVDGEWHDEYTFSPSAHSLADFAPGCAYHQSSPQSTFTQKMVCSRATPTGRITLTGDRLIRSEDGVRNEVAVSGDVWQKMLLDHFGITIDQMPPSLTGEMSGH